MVDLTDLHASGDPPAQSGAGYNPPCAETVVPLSQL